MGRDDRLSGESGHHRDRTFGQPHRRLGCAPDLVGERAIGQSLRQKSAMAKAGIPGATCTCTSTGRTSMPSNATVATRWTISAKTQLLGKSFPADRPMGDLRQASATM